MFSAIIVFTIFLRKIIEKDLYVLQRNNMVKFNSFEKIKYVKSEAVLEIIIFYL